MKKSFKVIFVFVICLSIFSNCFASNKTDLNNINLNNINLNEIDTQSIQEYAKEKNINLNNVDSAQAVEVYEQLLENYSNDEIANMIEKNADKLEAQGISQDLVNAGTTILKSMDEDQVKDILLNDIDIDSITQSIENGDSAEKIIQNIQSDMTTSEKVSLFFKVLFASYIFKYTIIGIFVITIYKFFIRWIIYKKAGRHGFASIIPLYREITMLNICQLSPWILLFMFVPVIGWFALFIIKIMTRFRLSEAFGRGAGFGFGLLIFRTIFESILAFSGNMNYTGIDE